MSCHIDKNTTTDLVGILIGRAGDITTLGVSKETLVEIIRHAIDRDRVHGVSYYGGFHGGVGSLAGRGVAVGHSAKTQESADRIVEIDAIQLGTGTNIKPKTLQVYDFTLLDSDGIIPDDRLPSSDTFEKPDFRQDLDSTSGLHFAYKEGSFRRNNTTYNISGGNIELAPNNTNYIELSQAGISSNIGGFALGRIPLYKATTGDNSIISVEDQRSWLNIDVIGERSIRIITDFECDVHPNTEVYLGDTSAQNVSMILPHPDIVENYSFTFRKIKEVNAFNIERTGEGFKIVFNGEEFDLITLEDIGSWVTIKSDGSNYQVVSDSGLTAEANFDTIV